MKAIGGAVPIRMSLSDTARNASVIYRCVVRPKMWEISG